MSNNLRVSLRAKMSSPFAERLFELQVIFDDAVVDHNHIARAVRMRVGFRRSPMSCPARVADADRSAHWLPVEHRFQIVQLAFATANRHLAVVQHGNARRVVTPVLKLSQAV